MPITYGNASYRKKFDAFRIVDQSGHEPLKEAIATAFILRDTRLLLQNDAEATKSRQARLIALQAVMRAASDEFQAWVKIAEFVYSKPKQLEISGTVTLEQLLAGTWDDKPATLPIGPPEIQDVG